MEKVVEIKNLKKNFSSFEALKNINFDIHTGEVLGYIGPNGSGKSTTIRVLLGLIKKSSGEVKIFGKDAWSDSIDIHRRIAYVPGDVYLWPNLTGREIIQLFMNLHGKGNQETCERLIQEFELDPKKKISSYSKGNRQKISLIAALSCEADLYIFDEPTSGLDPLMEVIFQREVEALKKKGKAILLSSHILSEVERLADRVVVIKNGELVETGSLDELRHFSRDSFRVKTERPATDLAKLSGVHDLKFEGDYALFQADSDKLEEILSTLMLYGIKKLESTAATLEELFIHHYEQVSEEK
ncbi:MAG: ATP-binding cassette domain-containing protein [Lactovum sp.]